VINNVRVFEDGTISELSIQEQNAQEQERQRSVRELCPENGAITDFELNRILARDERAGTPGKSYKKLRPFHWQGLPELPVYAADIPSPKRDILLAHDARVQRYNIVGVFCDSPIVTLDYFGMEVDEERELANRLAASSHISIPAEILPGEERCSDGIIRRTTAAEAVGYDEYKERCPVELPTGQSSYAKSKAHQSSPEEMCAWLNAQPKSSFKSEVVTEDEDKVLRTTDAKGKLLYAFRYVGGSNANVVECYDGDNGLHNYVPVKPKEYADEFISSYVPTSHVDRITIGGTALFVPEEEA
jgi:hypothetical protein